MLRVIRDTKTGIFAALNEDGRVILDRFSTALPRVSVVVVAELDFARCHLQSMVFGEGSDPYSVQVLWECLPRAIFQCS